MKRLIVSALCLLFVAPALGDAQTFPNDFDGFVQVAGPLSAIDFNILPDGQPSMGGEELTDDFNYDSQGVHFSALMSNPYIAGNLDDGFGLSVTEDDATIVADLITPAYAVGAFFPGGTELCVFDQLGLGAELGCTSYFEPGSGNFVGIVSTDPIWSATFNSGQIAEGIESFVFSPVPEPGTCVLFATAAALLVRRKRRTASM